MAATTTKPAYTVRWTEEDNERNLRKLFFAAAPRGRHCDERLKVRVARLDNMVHAEAVDAKRVPLLLSKLSLLQERFCQRWVRQNFGARKRLEVGPARLDEVGTAQVGDAELVQVFLREVDRHLEFLEQLV